jgi:O-antigen/teichoic acid export membrane protein
VNPWSAGSLTIARLIAAVVSSGSEIRVSTSHNITRSYPYWTHAECPQLPSSIPGIARPSPTPARSEDSGPDGPARAGEHLEPNEATATADGTSAETPSDILSTAAAGPAAIRGGALRVSGYLVGVLVSALAAALLFRHLGRETAGLYVAATSLVAIVGAFSDLGLTAIGIREISILPPAEGWALARNLLGLRIVLTLTGGAAVTAIAWVAYSGEIAAGVSLASVGLLLLATQDNFMIPLTVGLRIGSVSALELSRQLLTTLLIVVLVALGAGIVPFLGVSIPVGLVVVSATVVLVRGERALAPTFDWRRWRALIGTMFPYTVAVAASALYLRVSVLLVSLLSSRAQLGYFGASFRIVEVLTVVPGLLVSAAFPIFARAARDDHERLGYALGKVFDVSLLVGAWVAVSVAIGAPLAVAIIGGPEFKGAAPVLAFQGVALGAMFVSMVWANGLLSLGSYRLIMVLNVSALAFNALLVALLIPLDGARGAAIGTAAAEIAVTIVQAVAVVHGRPALRPSLRVLPRAALAAAVGIVPIAFTGLPVIVRLLASTVLFGACVLATRALPEELLDLAPWDAGRWRPGGTR